jgi:alkylation response protein AidB-like acyl-CoA dehydrogenase
MDFALPADDDPRRLEVRAWLAAHPSPSRRDLAVGGFIAPHWPSPWGRDADAEVQLIIDDEFSAADVVIPGTSIGVGWAGPTIIAGGTQAQKDRFLPPMLDDTEDWCQLFSEPEAGSDLASLRTRAVRDGDCYVVNGSKLWSTRADLTDWGILLARTSDEGPRQHGISYFLLDMATPGIEVRPIIEMTGGRHFNETFLTDVRIPVENLVGTENEGWRLAKVTLANERVSLSEGGVLWGRGPDDEAVLDRIRSFGCDDPVLRQRIADLYTEMVILRLLNQRIMSARVVGADPGPLSSVRKAVGDVHGQKAMSLVKDLEGPSTMLDGHYPYEEHDDPWAWGHYFSRALTIGGGTSEVQRNIIGERLLGLPREPRPAT